MPKPRNIRAQKKDKLHQYLVDQQNEQQWQRFRPVSKRKGRHGHGYGDIHCRKQPLDGQQVGKIFRQQLRVLADVAVVETLNAEIIQDLKKIGEVEEGEIGSVVFPYPVLHPEVNPENENWLYQEIDKDEEEDV